MASMSSKGELKKKKKKKNSIGKIWSLHGLNEIQRRIKMKKKKNKLI
jgi:hypothetical protein